MTRLKILDISSFVFFFIVLPAGLFWYLSIDISLESLKMIYLRCAMTGILYFVLRETCKGYSPSGFYHKISNFFSIPENRRESLYKALFKVKLVVVVILGVAALYDIIFIIIPGVH